MLELRAGLIDLNDILLFTVCNTEPLTFKLGAGHFYLASVKVRVSTHNQMLFLFALKTPFFVHFDFCKESMFKHCL